MNYTSRFIKHIVYPSMSRWRGNRVLENVRTLKASERFSLDRLEALQLEKLKKLLRHSFLHVPAYQDFRHRLEDVERNPRSVFAEIPILRKAAFRDNRDRYLSDEANEKEMFLNRSGGSTGEPVTFYMNRYAVEFSEAARWRGLSWSGIQPWDPCLMIWGSPIELAQHQMLSFRLRERWLKNRVLIPAFALDQQKISEYRRRIERFQPAYIYGWPSSMSILAQLLLSSGGPLRVQLKGVVSTAETLSDAHRDLLKEAFGAPVINEYGAREGGILAYECPAGNLHATAENSWLEVVHPQTYQPVPEGESGLLVVTDLNNFVMPRLRYELGDLVSLSSRTCRCGRTLPILEAIDGRSDDTFITDQGILVNGQYFTNIARLLPSVTKFQIVQQSPSQILLRLKDVGLTEQDVQSFCTQIRDKMGNVSIEVERVTDIPAAASGKVRVAMRQFPLPSKHAD